MANESLTSKVNKLLYPNEDNSRIQELIDAITQAAQQNGQGYDQSTQGYNPFLKSNGETRLSRIPSFIYQRMIDNSSNPYVQDLLMRATGLTASEANDLGYSSGSASSGRGSGVSGAKSQTGGSSYSGSSYSGSSGGSSYSGSSGGSSYSGSSGGSSYSGSSGGSAYSGASVGATDYSGGKAGLGANADPNKLGDLDIATELPKLSKQQIEAVISQKFSNSPVIKPSDAEGIYQAQQQTGMSAIAILGIGGLESGWGTSQIARDKNNLWGWQAYDSSPYESAKTFKPIGEGALDYAKGFMDTFYSGRGTRTINQTGAGEKTAQNPNGYKYATSAWAPAVSRTMADVYNVAKQAGDFQTDLPKAKSGRSNGSLAEKQNAVVEAAKSYLGTPYVWGGTTPKGFDCSGLVQYVYKNDMGLTDKDISRTTYTQIKDGEAVDRKDLEPGDLVFFNNSGKNDHVGIYIGDNQFIHAPHTGDVVKISDLGSSYYNSHYSGARRILKPDPTPEPTAEPTATGADASNTANGGGSRIAEAAKNYVGKAGLNTSGELAHDLFESYGVSIPPTIATQYESGTPVDTQDLQPGDLVFYGQYSPVVPRPTKVGVYVGDGQFVEGSERGVDGDTVKIRNVSDLQDYKGARRYEMPGGNADQADATASAPARASVPAPDTKGGRKLDVTDRFAQRRIRDTQKQLKSMKTMNFGTTPGSNTKVYYSGDADSKVILYDDPTLEGYHSHSVEKDKNGNVVNTVWYNIDGTVSEIVPAGEVGSSVLARRRKEAVESARGTLTGARVAGSRFFRTKRQAATADRKKTPPHSAPSSKNTGGKQQSQKSGTATKSSSTTKTSYKGTVNTNQSSKTVSKGAVSVAKTLEKDKSAKAKTISID